LVPARGILRIRAALAREATPLSEDGNFERILDEAAAVRALSAEGRSARPDALASESPALAAAVHRLLDDIDRAARASAVAGVIRDAQPPIRDRPVSRMSPVIHIQETPPFNATAERVGLLTPSSQTRGQPARPRR
jgi:hypothetical protein